MLKRLVAALAAIACIVAGPSLPAIAVPLGESDLADPEKVAQHLRSGMTEEDRRMAAASYLAGELIRQRHRGTNWGPLVKAYGDSAVHRPAPAALKAYVEANLRSWREWSNPQPDLDGAKRALLRQARGIYAAALAADDILGELSAAQRAEISGWRDCVAAYLDTDTRATDCQPLLWIAAP